MIVAMTIVGKLSCSMHKAMINQWFTAALDQMSNQNLLERFGKLHI